MDWVFERLREPSTWRGIIGLLTAAGVAISPDLAGAIVTAGVAVVCVIEVARKERLH